MRIIKVVSLALLLGVSLVVTANDYPTAERVEYALKVIAVGELLTEQSGIMFCRRDGNSAHEDMLRMISDIKKRLWATPKGAVYYSCLGRGRNQFGENSEELKLIRDELGEFPLVGFFANGEIFHNRL